MNRRLKHTVFIFTFVILLYLFFWHLPLLKLDALKTASQDPNFSDQNYYLYIANNLTTQKFITFDDLNVTWSSFGIVGYLYLGKMIFQTEFFYVLVNPILFLLGWMLVVKNLKKSMLIRKDGLLLLCLFPSMLLTLSTPGKEFLAIFGTLIFYNGCIYYFICTRKRIALWYLIWGLLIVGASRPHESALLIFTFLIFKSLTESSWVKSLLVFASLFIIGLWSTSEIEIFKDLLGSIQNRDLFFWDISAKSTSSFLATITSKLSSENLFIHSILGIPRIIIVFLAPLITSLRSMVAPENTSFGFDYFIFRDLSSILRMIDIIFTIWIIRFSTVRINNKMSPGGLNIIRFFMLHLFLSYYSIVYFGIVEKSRYFIQFGFVWLLIFLLTENSERTDPSLRLTSKIGS